MNDGTPNDKSDAPAWQTRREGAALVATLDRYSVRNALNFRCWEELDGLLTSLEADATVRVLIITGGEAIFSAGGDMKNVESRGDGLMKQAARLKYLQTVLLRLARCPIPTIAAVEGAAIGVAWGLVLTCDFVVASRTASFAASFTERNLVPDGGLAFHITRAAGRVRATDILLGNRKLSAEEAVGYGLASEVVDKGGALKWALALSERLAATSRDTIMLSLRALRRAEHGSHRDYLDAELELAALNLHNPDVAGSRMSFSKPTDVPAKTEKAE